MAQIETARGPVEPSARRRTLKHEHVFVLTPDSQRQWSREWDEEKRVAEAIAALNTLSSDGIGTIVDPTVDGLGRDVSRIVRIQAAVGLNIVMATGIYTWNEAPNYFRYRTGDGEDPMVRLFVKDLEEGIGDSEVKAAFLKCAVDRPGMTQGVERVMTAVVAAHHRTGAPVMVHTHPKTGSTDLARRFLEKHGVEPSSVLLAHVGDSSDVGYLSRLAGKGYVLGMDRFGLDTKLDFETRVDVAAELCRQGLSRNLTLSQDSACYIDWMDEASRAALPNWHYRHVLTDVVPALRERGVDESDIDEMLVGAPARFLGRSARQPTPPRSRPVPGPVP